MTTLAAPFAPGLKTVAEIESATRKQRFAMVLTGVLIALFGATYMQRIGWVIDELSQIPICILTTALSFALFYVSGLFHVSATRLMLFAAAAAGIILAIFVALPLGFSVFSLFYLVVLYAP